MALPQIARRVLTPETTFLFICDIQTKFRQAVHGFEHVVATTNKMVKISKLLSVEVVVSEQNPRALGPTVPEIDLSILGHLHLKTADKTLFSMVTPEIKSLLDLKPTKTSVIIVGVESHVCVLQSTLDLRRLGYEVYVLADGVSSCNAAEVLIALARAQEAGAFVSTSESVAFQLMRDSAGPTFKDFSALIKEEKQRTKNAVEFLVQVMPPKSLL